MQPILIQYFKISYEQKSDWKSIPNHWSGS